MGAQRRALIAPSPPFHLDMRGQTDGGRKWHRRNPIQLARGGDGGRRSHTLVHKGVEERN